MALKYFADWALGNPEITMSSSGMKHRGVNNLASETSYGFRKTDIGQHTNGLGKIKCKELKKVRVCIAEFYGISYKPSECTYEGECSGTCPRCERELHYLEVEIAKRGLCHQKSGDVVNVTVGTGCSLAGSCE